MRRSHTLLYLGLGVAALYFLGQRSTAANAGGAYQLPNGTWVPGAQGFQGTGALARYTPTGGTGRIY